MSNLSLRLPDSLHRLAKDLAKEDSISLNQLITSALAEKISALQTEKYLQQRASEGSKQKFLAALDAVPNTKPDPIESKTL